MFVPIVDGLLLPLSKAAPAIRAVLAEIPKLFSTNKNVETIVLPTVQAGLDALKVSIFRKNRIGNCVSLKDVILSKVRKLVSLRKHPY